MVKIMENPIKMDDLGVPLFSETAIYVTATLIKPFILPGIISNKWMGAYDSYTLIFYGIHGALTL